MYPHLKGFLFIRIGYLEKDRESSDVGALLINHWHCDSEMGIIDGWERRSQILLEETYFKDSPKFVESCLAFLWHESFVILYYRRGLGVIS